MTLKRSLIVVALLGVAGCNKDPEPAPPPAEAPKPAPAPAAAPAPEEKEDESPVAWIIHSGDGNATLRQKPAAATGKCYLECSVGTAVAWSAPSAPCFGDKSDRKFLAN